jgi:threonine dehydratase
VILESSAIDEAADRISPVAKTTPLQPNERLSRATGADVWLKREDLQGVRSYKIRGAFNFISQLTDDERRHGVICASAGNHGQGVAQSCACLGIRGQVYIPATTPRQKRERIMSLGAGRVELVVAGDTYDEAASAAKIAAFETGAVLVPAFDDLRTVAGQGTVAKELVGQLGRAPDVVMVPVGGGGLLAGCLTWLAEHCPTTRVVGLEPAGAACLIEAVKRGAPCDLPTLESFVDGAAVRRAGDLTFAIASHFKPRLVAVPEGRVCSEMLGLYQVDGIIAEPAGALASAGLAHSEEPDGPYYRPRPGETVVAIVSGGNNDVSRYAEILERSLVHEGRKHYFLVSFPQEPGALRRFLDDVLGPDDDITHFEYTKRSNRELGPALVGIELGDPADYPGLIQRLEDSPIGFETVGADSPFYRFLV